MTDAEKREKAIRGLECCKWSRQNVKPEKNKCDECPYKDQNIMNAFTVWKSCTNVLAGDALALLKKQEPRVLEYSEIEKHPLVWLEDNDKEDVIPALFLQYNGWNAEFAVQAPDECVDTIIRSAIVIAVEGTYGITWRAWSAQPTDEQRKAVKWG